MKNRTRDYYRKMRKKAIKRKKRIINSYNLDNPPKYEIAEEDAIPRSYGRYDSYWYVRHEGMLAKGKIHCSCDMCAFHGVTRKDKRTLMSMEDKIKDYYYNDESNICPDDLLSLKNKLHKQVKGNYYPNRGLYGSKIPVDKRINVEEFKEKLIERKKMLLDVDRVRIMSLFKSKQASSHEIFDKKESYA